MRLAPPPKSRGVLGLLVALIFVGWTVYLLTSEKPAPMVKKTQSGSNYIMVDLSDLPELPAVPQK